MFRAKGITHFNYIVHFKNLKSIITIDTIRPRNFLVSRDISFHDISREEYQLSRRNNFERFFPEDDIHDYVPLYISSHTPLVKRLAHSPNYLYFAILKIKCDVLKNNKHNKKQVKASNQNINQLSLDNFQIKELHKFESVAECEHFWRWDLFNSNVHFTNESERLSKAAEVLIPQKVHRKFIDKICLKNTHQRKILATLRNFLGSNFYERIEDFIDFYTEDFEFLD